MTQSMYLCSVSQPQTGARLVNDTTAVLVNASSVSNAKLNAALALAHSNVPDVGSVSDTEADFYQNIPNVPSTYFDTAVIASSSGGVPGSGNGSVAGDAYVFIGQKNAPVYVDHTAYTPV